MNLRICILPAKVLADGTHKIRIAMSHNGTTRYFVTRFVIPSSSNISNGRVVGVDNATYINRQLSLKVSKIYEVYDKIEDSEYLTCSQLISMIEDNMVAIKPKTLVEIATEYINTLKSKSISKTSLYIYSKGFEEIKSYFGDSFTIRSLNTFKVNEYMCHLKERLNDTTVGIRMRFLKLSVSYAIRHKYVSYDISPFEDVHVPKSGVRNCVLTLEELRRIRDLEIDLSKKHGNSLELARNTFMASFFLCGMNISDLMSVDFSGEEVSFKRTKTASRKKNAPVTVFTIQPEAREYLNKIMENGKIKCNCKYTATSLTSMLHRFLSEIGELCETKNKLMFYSARKTFAQLANEIMIKDSIIEYCIGDTVSTSGKVIGHYINVNQRMADKAIRKVFDAVNSNKSIDEIIDDTI